MPTARALHRLSSALLCAFLARAAFAANIEYADFRKATPEFYEAGGMGPHAAYAMLEKVGRSWKRPAGVKHP